MDVKDETTLLLFLMTGEVVAKFSKGFVSGELGMEDEAQYSHVALMISDDHLLTGTPPFYIQHYHGTLAMGEAHKMNECVLVILFR